MKFRIALLLHAVKATDTFRLSKVYEIFTNIKEAVSKYAVYQVGLEKIFKI
jgi:hypothetical protein